MNTGNSQTEGGQSSGFDRIREVQPYYIGVPPGGRKTTYGNLLHRLCSALNALGCPAYLDGSEPSGDLWTPVLTEALRVAHFKAGKKPIVVGQASSALQKIGLQVAYEPDARNSSAAKTGRVALHTLSYVQGSHGVAPHHAVFVPAFDLAMLDSSALRDAPGRQGIAFIHSQFVAAGGKARDFGPDAVDLALPAYETEAAMRELLCKTRVLYAFEPSVCIDLARLCGCPVVMVPNAFTLKSKPLSLQDKECDGISWGEDPQQIETAADTVLQWRAHYIEQASGWQASLQAFVKTTQQAANALTLDAVWPQASVDALDIKNLSPAEMGARADRMKYRRVNEQFERWSKFCTIREIDADIYARHLASGKLPALSVVIDQRGSALDALADTLDSLGECLWRPAHVLIVSDQPAPDALEQNSDLSWVTVAAGGRAPLEQQCRALSDWVLLVQSGTRFAPQSLVEWGLAVNTFPQAQLIYADEDVWQAEGPAQYPFFKPDANIELLRCTNYLGSALLARRAPWVQAGLPLFDGGLYGYALDLLHQQGRAALAHIDTVLVHAVGALSTEVESLEYDACSRHLKQAGLSSLVRPLDRLGTWVPEYQAPTHACVSLVVPTGIQTGYLRTLLESLLRYPQAVLAEVLLVCEPQHLDEVEYVLAHVQLDVPVRLLTCPQENYSHAVALNAGVEQAAGPFVLVCDDDTEALHKDWLGHLVGIAQQADVGCVGPRLMSNRDAEARVTGGPLVMGVKGGFVPYNGEAGLLSECGVHSRLQLTQDVSAVAGHCFVFRKADWAAVHGFDAQNFGLFFTVPDFCLRLSKLGRRQVWTPLTSVLHQGGKTVEVQMRDTRKRLQLADVDVNERDNLLRLWAAELASDPCYNRHLSLLRPYDVEHLVVVDWQPRRHDRPRVLACPLTSGAGQYRVVDPLNSLQDAGLAQTCVVIPNKRGETRILQPLELVRAAPDRLILQHSVDDGQLGMVDKYRMAMPGIHIIQMVDDLLGEVPEKHPNRNFQVREGHQRMARALKQSDRLVVTTEPLIQHYQKYVRDVRLMPNCLDPQWSGLRLPRTVGRRLRVGWIGAGQHQGDLELVSQVVRETASEVDWVFMGMCTEEIKPHIKEYHDFVSFVDYPKKMSSLDLDIAIAPLEQNFFNECKSNLRLLEYGAMGWPVVCSDVFPYRTLNPPVIRCANDPAEWIGALRKLMADQRLRHQMGEQLHQWVNDNFMLVDKAQDWMKAIFDEAVSV